MQRFRRTSGWYVSGLCAPACTGWRARTAPVFEQRANTGVQFGSWAAPVCNCHLPQESPATQRASGGLQPPILPPAAVCRAAAAAVTLSFRNTLDRPCLKGRYGLCCFNAVSLTQLLHRSGLDSCQPIYCCHLCSCFSRSAATGPAPSCIRTPKSVPCGWQLSMGSARCVGQLQAVFQQWQHQGGSYPMDYKLFYEKWTVPKSTGALLMTTLQMAAGCFAATAAG